VGNSQQKHFSRAERREKCRSVDLTERLQILRSADSSHPVAKAEKRGQKQKTDRNFFCHNYPFKIAFLPAFPNRQIRGELYNNLCQNVKFIFCVV
jgi:hypothetical protein